MKQKKYFKPAFALLAGFLSIFVLNTITRLFIFQKIQGIARQQSALDTPIYNSILHTIVSLIIPIIGGIVVGYLVKKNGAYYGGALAIILKFISSAIIASILIYPPTFYNIPMQPEAAKLFAIQNLTREIISLPFAILFMAWGGWMGEKLARIVQSHELGHPHQPKEQSNLHSA